jgi:type VI protein secretion system component Hcp
MGNDREFPWLGIHCRRSPAGNLEDFPDYRLRNLLILEISDAFTLSYRFNDIQSLSPFFLF